MKQTEAQPNIINNFVSINITTALKLVVPSARTKRRKQFLFMPVIHVRQLTQGPCAVYVKLLVGILGGENTVFLPQHLFSIL